MLRKGWQITFMPHAAQKKFNGAVSALDFINVTLDQMNLLLIVLRFVKIC